LLGKLKRKKINKAKKIKKEKFCLKRFEDDKPRWLFTLDLKR
jgi:hypothetical protein